MGRYSDIWSRARHQRALWTPYDSGLDCQQIFDFEDPRCAPGAIGDSPATIYDVSGKGKNSISRTGTPVLAMHPQLGRCLQFNGTNYYVHNAGPGTEYGFSFLLSVRTATGGDYVTPYCAQRASTNLRIWVAVRNSSSNTAQMSHTGYFIGATTLNVPMGLIGRYAADQLNNAVNVMGAINGKYVYPNNNAAIYGDGIKRCGVGGEGTGNWGFTGYIAACGYVKTPALPTVYDMQRMEGYWFHKKKIQSLLSATHPFRNRPPLDGD